MIFSGAKQMCKTIYWEARQRAIRNDPCLSDRRSLYYDGVVKSVNESIFLETDSSYIPHPSVPAKLIYYFTDIYLANDVCRLCLITKTKCELKISDNDSVLSTLDLSISKNTSSNNSPFKKQRRILKEIRNKNKTKTYYYYRRLELALINSELTDRYYVSLQTGISYKTLSELENNKNYIPRFETLNSLLRFYKDFEIANEICCKCPVRQISNQLKKDEDLINDKRETIERENQ
jgi:hypothetical protein